MQSIKRLGLALVLVLGMIVPAFSLAQEQEGLVNVNIGDVTIAEQVGIGVAANVAVEVCGVQVGPIGVLARQVATQDQVVVCQVEQEGQTVDVTITDE